MLSLDHANSDESSVIERILVNIWGNCVLDQSLMFPYLFWHMCLMLWSLSLSYRCSLVVFNLFHHLCIQLHQYNHHLSNKSESYVLPHPLVIPAPCCYQCSLIICWSTSNLSVRHCQNLLLLFVSKIHLMMVFEFSVKLIVWWWQV